MLFTELVAKVRKNKTELPKNLLAYDPGNTTGWAFFHEGAFIKSGQITTPPGDYAELYKHLKGHVQEYRPEMVVIENYVVYKNKIELHANMELWVPKIIGVMHFFYSMMIGAEIKLQLASEVKAFCTDEKLKAWKMYNVANKHANDATRHGCKYLIFN